MSVWVLLCKKSTEVTQEGTDEWIGKGDNIY